MFESSVYDGVYRPFNVEQSFDDVQTYFLDEFARIHHEHRQTMSAVPLPWPLPDVLHKLVQKSSGYFIYASTVIKFIDDRNYRPTERLAIVMKVQTESDSAFEALDQLYISILSTALIAKQPQLIPMLCALSNFDLPPYFLDRLLGVENGESRLFLRGLHSVFEVPPEEQEKESLGPISAHHASFYDFLHDPKRSQNFYVGGLPDRMDLARSILRLYAHEFPEDYDWNTPYSRSPIIGWPHFIATLPPSAELLPLVQSVHLNYITELHKDSLKTMLTWMRKSHPAPEDVIQLWEDYEYFFFIEREAIPSPFLLAFSSFFA
ncbi:hypothetical protein BDP27DRAFT_1413400 [Rhodocollybia butyracea]|uniref:Uncharacterized protein n=1 Tax=Rhodocollybia butyracea TaxID=206335 RepID=A0A9P5QA02_9AGAR|nr:hypothetical protein BDP27DRAFT_1413400 [Rhodocollybia butyracea]